MPSQDFGTAFSHGLSIYTAGGSAVSAYGPIIGRTITTAVLTASANSSIDTTFSVPGAAVGDAVIVGPPSAVSGDLAWGAFVPSAGNVTLRLSNVSGTNNVQTAQDWSVTVIRRSFITSIR